jgi:hypothetical protein
VEAVVLELLPLVDSPLVGPWKTIQFFTSEVKITADKGKTTPLL